MAEATAKEIVNEIIDQQVEKACENHGVMDGYDGDLYLDLDADELFDILHETVELVEQAIHEKILKNKS